MSEPKLKPCPFCGEREDIRTIPWDPCIQVYIVWCGKCRCDGPEAVTGEEAIGAWQCTRQSASLTRWRCVSI